MLLKPKYSWEVIFKDYSLGTDADAKVLYFLTAKDGFWHLPVTVFCSFLRAVSAIAPPV